MFRLEVKIKSQFDWHQMETPGGVEDLSLRMLNWMFLLPLYCFLGYSGSFDWAKPMLKGLLVELKSPSTGIIIRVYLCWNFGRLVPGAVKSHRCSTKSHESYHLCALFGTKSPQTKPV